MHASTVFFATLSLLAGLVAAADYATCCDGGIQDPTGDHCSKLGQLSYCCDPNDDANHGRGCDDNHEYPIGRVVTSYIPGGMSCSSGNKVGFPACA
ncbi:hypothetical protein LX36DRAFT_586859 [Colletotrichum falcatum]|nr:hypothetical protein LX36DRAFT_586859 [Colletotrichum falcatum]